MPLYNLRYQTKNQYQNHVGEAVFALLVLPANDPNQQLLDFKVTNSLDEPSFLQKNLFGFNQLMIRTIRNFNDLELIVECEVEVLNINPFDGLSLSVQDETELIHSHDFRIDHQIFLTHSQTTFIRKQDLEDNFLKSSEVDCATFLQGVNKKIFSDFAFEDSVDSLNRDVNSTIAEKSGVCQDFANLFIGICRANGIPARFVSGYLNQGENFVGSAFMHAWVEAFVPNMGWQGYDPTNNLMRDSNYVKVCHGVDYKDCAPIKGVLKTSGENFTKYQVTVEQQ